jgi:hypothetical protein
VKDLKMEVLLKQLTQDAGSIKKEVLLKLLMELKLISFRK